MGTHHPETRLSSPALSSSPFYLLVVSMLVWASLFLLFVSSFLYLSLLNLSSLLALTCSEKCNTKPAARTNQVRPREAPSKKQQSATVPTTTKPTGGTSTPTKHKDAAPGAKKPTKTAGKTGPATQAKSNPRHTNATDRGLGKFSSLTFKPVECCRLPAWSNRFASLGEEKQSFH